MRERCFIGIGSNINHPILQVKTALMRLAQLPDSYPLATSPLYQTQPVGYTSQPDFINAVMAIKTALSPLILLKELQKIENEQGRVRDIRWGPRTLDVDLLLYDNQQFQTPELTIPHPRLTERAFVLRPLLDIAPDFILPNGAPLQTAYDQLPENERQAVVLLP